MQGYLQIDGTCYQGTQMKKIDNFVTKEFSQETNFKNVYLYNADCKGETLDFLYKHVLYL